MIGVVDYGMGNLCSVVGALEYLGADAALAGTPERVRACDKLIIPGVGSFRLAMENLAGTGLKAALDERVRGDGIPALGICLGMQLLAERGDEDGPTPGLGWVRGTVERFPARSGLPIPHVGFNAVEFAPTNDLFASLGSGVDFYFVHSYRLVADDPTEVTAWCDYGGRFAAAVQCGNVFGTQFHPEKSQANGLQLLRNFLAV